ncbi:MAG: FeoA family protein [Sulfolobales archaeon]
MVPLSEAKPGALVRVVEVSAGRGLKLRLEQLGLFPGSLIEVVTNNHGHVLIKARGAIISLSRGVASKVFVERSSTNT